MKYFTITAKIVEVIIHSVQNEIPCRNLIHEHDRSLQGDHAERPSGIRRDPDRFWRKVVRREYFSTFFACSIVAALPALFLLLPSKK
jgi:hypothetical protein